MTESKRIRSHALVAIVVAEIKTAKAIMYAHAQK